MKDLKIITVVNDFDCFEKTVKINKFMNKYEMFTFDNIKENLPITRRYNSFLEDQIFSKKITDSWLVFCHQDFGFLEDPLEILKKENPKNILGVVGARKRKIPFLKKRKIRRGYLWQGMGNAIELGRSEKDVAVDPNLRIINGTLFHKNRHRQVPKQGIVDTVDCCCIIAHSSTVQKFNLKFDENLLWDMYAEDFCLNAKFNHHIKTKTTPIESYHISLGNNGTEKFIKAMEFVKNKYPKKLFSGTCFN